MNEVLNWPASSIQPHQFELGFFNLRRCAMSQLCVLNTGIDLDAQVYWLM